MNQHMYPTGAPRCDQTVAWTALRGHFEGHGRDFDLREAFERDPARFGHFSVQAPDVFADFSKISDLDDVTFAKWMTAEIGVATVPGSSFYAKKEDGRTLTRFAFCKKQETLEDAAERLSRLRAALEKRG